jgi:hypothetical protein
MSVTPTTDIEMVERAMRYFVAQGQLGEVRILSKQGKSSGFFFYHEEISLAAQLAAEHDLNSKGIYLVMNKIDPAVLAGRRTLDILHHNLTREVNIVRRKHLLIDCDPSSSERDPGDSSTDDEKSHSRCVRDAICNFLSKLGFPEPTRCDSGNGSHILWSIDLPSDFQAKQLVKTFLIELARYFNTDHVKVDVVVSNASRITKLYGTVARKGEDRPNRPHRLSSIEVGPMDTTSIVTREMIQDAIRDLSMSRGSSLDLTKTLPSSANGQCNENTCDVAFKKPKLIVPERFLNGERHCSLVAVAGAVRSFGSTECEILEVMRIYNKTRCIDATPDDELQRIARDFARKDCNLSMKTLMESGTEDEAESSERQQKLKQAIDYAGRQIASDNSPSEVITKLSAAIEEFRSQDRPQTFRTMTSAELDSADLHTEYLVTDVMARMQATIIAAAKKSLKTNTAIDLTLSLASRSPFLGKFCVPEAVRVALMSGESGERTIQETAQRIARSKPWPNLSNYENAVWSFDLPRLGHPQTKRELVSFIEDQRLQVLIIDPAYLCLDLGDDAGNLFSVGKKLRELTDIQNETGCTIVIIHHNVKSKGDPFAVPELESIAWSGFQEWARQWILIGRREAYRPDQAGSHKLWFSVGGSAGHSGLWGIDIEEGSPTDQEGRRWEVSIDGASQVIAESISEREQTKEQQAQAKAGRQLAADAEKLLKEYRKRPEGDTAKSFRERAQLNGARAGAANDKLIASGQIVPWKVIKNGRSFDGFKLAESVIGTDRDRVGKTGFSPDGAQSGTAAPIGGSPGPAHRDTTKSLFESATDSGPVSGGRPA